METLGDALPKAIAMVSEFIGQQDAMAKELDEVGGSGSGDGTRMVASLLRVKRDAAVAAQQSGDVVAMLAAYQELKPAMDLAKDEPETE